jgi:putative mRNA 3-end processing factor
MKRYLCSKESENVLRLRVGDEANIDTLDYGKTMEFSGVKLSLHPAGHILGSAQIRMEHQGEVWVVSGDYKTDPDPTCAPFELVKCHVFVTESTFGLPIYQWPDERKVFESINNWWRANQATGKASMIYGYTLGKIQRVLAGIDPSIGPILAHGAVQRMNRAYRATGVDLPPTEYAGAQPKGFDYSQALVLSPPSANGSPWLRRFGQISTGFASGWMHIRGFRRRRAVDRGFVLSDHIDWPALLATVKGTGAERVWVTHGYSNIVARYLEDELGLQTEVIPTQFEGELDIGGEEAKAEAEEGDGGDIQSPEDLKT